jgi:hypothetical protein
MKFKFNCKICNIDMKFSNKLLNCKCEKCYYNTCNNCNIKIEKNELIRCNECDIFLCEECYINSINCINCNSDYYKFKFSQHEIDYCNNCFNNLRYSKKLCYKCLKNYKFNKKLEKKNKEILKNEEENLKNKEEKDLKFLKNNKINKKCKMIYKINKNKKKFSK